MLLIQLNIFLEVSSYLLVKTPFQRSSTCPILTTSDFERCLLKCSSKGGNLNEQRRGLVAVTQQQKNRNICEWLQKVSGTDSLSETSSITSVNEKTFTTTPG